MHLERIGLLGDEIEECQRAAELMRDGSHMPERFIMPFVGSLFGTRERQLEILRARDPSVVAFIEGLTATQLAHKGSTII